MHIRAERKGENQIHVLSPRVHGTPDQTTHTETRAMRSHPDSPYGKAWAQACREIHAQYPGLSDDEKRPLVVRRTDELMASHK
jgi:hypothetical protein